MKKRKKGAAPSVVLINPKYAHNVGAALRACSCFGIDQLWWTGHRVSLDVAKGERLPREERMRGYADVEMCPDEYPLNYFDDAVPVAVEVRQTSECLTTFEHPEKAVYIFGPEDGSIPKAFAHLCHRFVHIPSHHCLNLASAVNVILYDRRAKRQVAGVEPILPLQDMLLEQRGPYDDIGRVCEDCKKGKLVPSRKGDHDDYLECNTCHTTVRRH